MFRHWRNINSNLTLSSISIRITTPFDKQILIDSRVLILNSLFIIKFLHCLLIYFNSYNLIYFFVAVYRSHTPMEKVIALIFLKPIFLSNEIDPERVGKFIIESAKYS